MALSLTFQVTSKAFHPPGRRLPAAANILNCQHPRLLYAAWPGIRHQSFPRRIQNDIRWDILAGEPESRQLISVAGNPTLRSEKGDVPSQINKAINFACLGTKHKETRTVPSTCLSCRLTQLTRVKANIPSYDCPEGLRGQVFFPNCWDGKNLDTDDHVSHMAYSGEVSGSHLLFDICVHSFRVHRVVEVTGMSEHSPEPGAFG